MLGVLGFFGKYHFERLNAEMREKADKSEIADLRKELRMAEERRDRDMERMDRLGNERYAELKSFVDQRFNSMEKNVSDKLSMILQTVRKS
jgi:hypothetical protein